MATPRSLGIRAWIGFSPIFVLQDMGASYATYIALQCVILSGFVLSSIAIQRLRQDFPLVHLLRLGGLVAAAGAALDRHVVRRGVSPLRPTLILGDRHQLDVREAELLRMFHETWGEFPVGEHFALRAAHP